jgi:hypothetical protein
VDSRIAQVLRIDAAMELVLAVGCLAVAVLAEPATLPAWFAPPVAIAVAAVLVLAAVVLHALAGRPDPAVLRAVAVANAVTAAIVLLVALLGLGAGVDLRIGLAVAAIVVAGLATVQVTWGRREVRPTTDDRRSAR